MAMAPSLGQWETFNKHDHTDEDSGEALSSLSDLPTTGHETQEHKWKSPERAVEEFEFQTCGGGGFLLKEVVEMEMCSADDIFYRGQLLPLRESVSRVRSRSYGNSLWSDTSIGSSNCSSTSISRSQSSSSHSSNCDMPKLCTPNKNHAQSSKRVQVRANANLGRNGTSPAKPGWALFRLGVVKAPEIELNNLRARSLRSNGHGGDAKVNYKPMRRFGCGCKCLLPDVSEPVSISRTRKTLNQKEEREVGIGLERRERVSRRSRAFEWLDEVSTGKRSVVA